MNQQNKDLTISDLLIYWFTISDFTQAKRHP